MSNFKVGQKVVCVDASSRTNKHISPPLVLGQEYVIKQIDECGCGKVSIHVGIYDAMALPTICPCGATTFGEKKWFHNPNRFRPLQYQSASFELASMFTQTEERADIITQPEKIKA